MLLGTLLFMFVSFLSCFAAVSRGTRWKYGETVHNGHRTVLGSQDWINVSRHCGGSVQSPTNIDTANKNIFQRSTYLREFSIDFDNLFGILSGRLVKKGHSFSIKIESGSALLSGGPWGSDHYKLAQLHFHFRCNSSLGGSEHTLNGVSYSAGELYLVFYNVKYANFQSAAEKSDGLTVIGVSLKENILGILNLELNKLAIAIEKVAEEDGKEGIPLDLNLYLLVPKLTDLSMTSFYSCKGSLTTSPCYQSVNWIVLSQHSPVSTYMMDVMRSLHDQNGLPACNNFRPTQPLNGRVVHGYM